MDRAQVGPDLVNFFNDIFGAQRITMALEVRICDVCVDSLISFNSLSAIIYCRIKRSTCVILRVTSPLSRGATYHCHLLTNENETKHKRLDLTKATKDNWICKETFQMNFLVGNVNKDG